MADLTPREYKALFRAITQPDAPRVKHVSVPDIPTTTVEGTLGRAATTEQKRQGKSSATGRDWRDQPTANADDVIARAARAQLARIARGGR